jgi:hypothetical protein
MKIYLVFMTERFRMGFPKPVANIPPVVMDKHESAHTGITPDQYDKLMRRLHALEQKVTMLGQNDYKMHELDELYDMQGKIVKEMIFIRKMMMKIGLALFKRAVK